jgi:HEAT repeat protein
MADTDIRQKALDALVIMNTAIKNVLLYPPSSATIVNTNERLYQAFQEMLSIENPVVFAESEKTIIICGNPLNQKDQEKNQVAALLNIFLNLGLKSISFERGLEKRELSAFAEILSRKPDVIKNEGGLSQVLSKSNITHIYPDQKIYMAVNKNSKFPSGTDIGNIQFAKFFTGINPELIADPQKFKEIVRDPKWLSQTFHAGLMQLMKEKGTLSDIQLTEELEKMIVLLDKAAGSLEKKDNEIISKLIGEDIVAADPGIAVGLTNQNTGNLFGGTFLKYLVGRIGDIRHAETRETGNGAGAPGGTGAGQSVAGGKGDTEFKTRLVQIAEKLILNLKENEKALLDEPLMSKVPKIIEQLNAHKEREMIEKIINRLVDKLFSENPKVRVRAARALTDIIDRLAPEHKTEIIERLSGRLIDWIKLETEATAAYKTVCNYLENTMQNFIIQLRYAETISFLDIFSDVISGRLEKNDAIREICAQLIRNLATEENITLLFKEFNTDGHNKKDEAGSILSRFGDIALKKMLDNLMESSDRNERVRIMQLIIGNGQKAMPLVMERINKNEPWFYMRNICYILGQIGNEESAGALQPFLNHENEKLRQEVLKSISRTGGNRRGKLLITALNGTDEKFKLSVIEALASAKASDIVPDLLDILKNRPFVTTSSRLLMEEQICVALGAIGSPEAIPVLSEIAETKSFFTISSYPEKVKTVALRALESIRKRKGD